MASDSVEFLFRRGDDGASDLVEIFLVEALTWHLISSGLIVAGRAPDFVMILSRSR